MAIKAATFEKKLAIFAQNDLVTLDDVKEEKVLNYSTFPAGHL